MTSAQLHDLPDGRLVRACGLVVMRQRPELMHSRLLAVYGVWQRDAETGGQVRHLIAGHLKDLAPLLGGLATQSREFH